VGATGDAKWAICGSLGFAPCATLNPSTNRATNTMRNGSGNVSRFPDRGPAIERAWTVSKSQKGVGSLFGE
jgi:hypothetical protein